MDWLLNMHHYNLYYTAFVKDQFAADFTWLSDGIVWIAHGHMPKCYSDSLLIS